MSIDLPLSRILDEIQSVVLERHAKYGATNISNSPGGPLNGLRVRLHDKLARLNNAVDSGNTDFDDDSFRDCFIDVVGYGLIGLLVVDGNWPTSEKPEKPLADLVDREQVARVLAKPETLRWSSLVKLGADPSLPDQWAVGTTFAADGSELTWTRGYDGWKNVAVFGAARFASLRRLVDHLDYTDGTITKPSNTLLKEAA